MTDESRALLRDRLAELEEVLAAIVIELEQMAYYWNVIDAIKLRKAEEQWA